MKKRNLAIWIPVITAIITMVTTIAVTYINATVKVAEMNRAQVRQHVSRNHFYAPEKPFARMKISPLGFRAVTNK